MVDRIGPIGTPGIPPEPTPKGRAADGVFDDLLSREIERLQETDAVRMRETIRRTSEILEAYGQSLAAFETSIDGLAERVRASGDVTAADLDPSLAHFRAMSGRLQDLRETTHPS